MNIKQIPTELFNRIRYDNGKLYWTDCIRTDLNGKEAGTPNLKDSHIRVSYKSKLYMAHRIIWEMHNGPVPKGLYLDHINGDRQDNRIENLRLATWAQNQHNTRSRRASSTDIKNVYWHKQSGKYRVEVNRKYFGSYKDINEAELVAKEAREHLHGEFANHG